MNKIEFYPIEKFIPHPNNPRKNLGDLTELADSIKAVGVLQNLIVVEEGNKLKVIAGHRRLEAAKKAGLKELPAVVRELTERQQQEMMLTENLQRSDLTLMEQAEGIQLLMDLGATVEEICSETGFSERTIYHRINIAKLDKKAIAKAEKERGEQLSLKDFILLEKIKDVKTRDRLLKEKGGARDISWHVDRAVEEEKREKQTKALETKAIKAGLENKGYKNSWDANVINYDSNNYRTIKNIPNTKFYGIRDNVICFYDLGEKGASEDEKKRKEAEKKRRQMIKMLVDIQESMQDKIRSYSWNLLDTAEAEEKEAVLYEILMFTAKEYNALHTQNEDDNLPGALETKEELLKFMLAESITGSNWIGTWDGMPKTFGHENIDEFLKFLHIKGFEWTEEEKNLIAGVHQAQMEIKKLERRSHEEN